MPADLVFRNGTVITIDDAQPSDRGLCGHRSSYSEDPPRDSDKGPAY